VSRDGLGFQSVSSLHTSCESIDISLGSGGGLSHNSSTGLITSSKEDSLTPFVRTNSVKTTLPERLVLCPWLPLSLRKIPFL
jgi:neuron navigator 2